MKVNNQLVHPFMHLSTGKRLVVSDMTPDMISIEDIAEGLAKEARFAGQTPGIFYSVAQHSVLMTELLMKYDKSASYDDLLAVLLHDAAEAYLGDQAKPVKVLLPDYNVLEDKLQSVILEHFDIKVSKELKSMIKHLDNRMVVTEAKQLFAEEPEWINDFIEHGIYPIDHLQIEPWPWEEALSMFMDHFRLLDGMRKNV